MAFHINEPVPVVGTVDNTSHVDGIVFPSAANGVGVYTSAEILNADHKGVRIYTDITVDGGGTVVVKIQTRDPVSKNWVDLTGAFSAALATATQTRTLTVYPGITPAVGTATTNTEVSNFVDAAWRVVATVSVATVTFSVGAVHLL